MKKILKLKNETDGQSLVEAALVFPVLILLILGMIEFGWILNGKITLTSAAREGARIYAVSKDSSNVKSTVENTTVNSGIIITNVTPVEEDYFEENIHNVKVTVEGSINPIIGLFFDGPVKMKSIAIMRKE